MRTMKWLLAVLVLCLAGSSHAGVVYFQVAERPGQVVHGDSFVLPLVDEQQIDHARDLIARGPDAAGAPIVFAQISKGADGVNRDLLAPGQPAWNWHVTGVSGFGDFGIELIDGWPTFVGNDVDGWINNTNGQIGFWSYTVVRELDGSPAAVPLPPALPVAGVMLAGLGFLAWRKRRHPQAVG